MNSYIEANCATPALEPPVYDEGSGTWDLFFAESEASDIPWGYTVIREQDLVCVPFPTEEIALAVYNEYQPTDSDNGIS